MIMEISLKKKRNAKPKTVFILTQKHTNQCRINEVFWIWYTKRYESRYENSLNSRTDFHSPEIDSFTVSWHVISAEQNTEKKRINTHTHAQKR